MAYGKPPCRIYSAGGRRRVAKIPAPKSVTALLKQLKHPHKDGIEALRALILKMDQRITEEIKWNAPSFKLDDPNELLQWPATDRCVLTLASTAELTSHRAAVLKIIGQWIAQVSAK